VQGKSDLHIHFHGSVGDGVTLSVNVPSLASINAKIDELRESILSRRQLSKGLSDAIELLSTKVTAVDNVVPDTPLPLNPVQAD
jgi:hypothetical protein